MDLAETYKQILGVKTKGGFPTIVFKEFNDLEEIDGDQRFYYKKTGDYIVVKDRIVYLWNDGQSSLIDFERKAEKQRVYDKVEQVLSQQKDVRDAEQRFNQARADEDFDRDARRGISQ